MSRDISSKTLFNTALRHYEIIDQAYFENGGKIFITDDNANAINALIKHRLAWQFEDMETVQLSSALIKLLERTGSAAKRNRGSDEIASLWQNLEDLLEEYRIVRKKYKENELERLSNEMHECAFELMEAINFKLTSFANYIDQGFSAVSDLDVRLLHNRRALKAAEQLNNILQGCDLNDFSLSTSGDVELRKLFRVYMPKSLSVYRKELVRVLHDLRKSVTKLQADSELAKQLISFKRLYDKKPGFKPTEIPFLDRIPTILTQSIKANSFAYPDVNNDAHKDVIISAIKLVKHTIQLESEIIVEQLDIQDATNNTPSITDIGELYEKSLVVIDVVKSGSKVKASESFTALEVSCEYHYWLLALLNTVSGLEKTEREKIFVDVDSIEHPLFNGNHYVNDITLNLC